MSAAVDQARTQLRGRRGLRIEAEPWHPPVLADLAPGRVLAFDATLSHCGWVLMEATEASFRVWDRGTINPATDQTSYLETWHKARQLAPQLDRLFVTQGCDAEIVVEAPLASSMGSRTESSLIAGMLVWMHAPARTAVVSATRVSKVLLGDHQVRSAERKKAIRAAVIALVPGCAGRDWNEHMRDALATGLTYLLDKSRRPIA